MPYDQVISGVIKDVGATTGYDVYVSETETLLDVQTLYPQYEYPIGTNANVGVTSGEDPEIVSPGILCVDFPGVTTMRYALCNALQTRWAKGVTKSIAPAGQGQLFKSFQVDNPLCYSDNDRIYAWNGVYKVDDDGSVSLESTTSNIYNAWDNWHGGLDNNVANCFLNQTMYFIGNANNVGQKYYFPSNTVTNLVITNGGVLAPPLPDAGLLGAKFDYFNPDNKIDFYNLNGLIEFTLPTVADFEITNGGVLAPPLPVEPSFGCKRLAPAA